MDRVLGLDSPGTPGWTLNETTDLLLKKEFDECRQKQTPHRLFLKNDLAHLVPFQHDDINKWRDSLHHGLIARFFDTNIVLTGGVDDIWLNTKNKKIVIADYKSQANSKPLNAKTYLSDVYKEGYKVQMDFYAFLLLKMGFEVDKTAYFLVCNANREASGFYGEMKFQEALIPYNWKAGWIDDKVYEMIEILNSTNIPSAHPSCKNCAYASRRAEFESL